MFIVILRRSNHTILRQRSGGCFSLAVFVSFCPQGEARVFKYLHPGNIDVQARRKKVQAMKNAQNVFHIKKKILNFVEDREYSKIFALFLRINVNSRYEENNGSIKTFQKYGKSIKSLSDIKTGPKVNDILYH